MQVWQAYFLRVMTSSLPGAPPCQGTHDASDMADHALHTGIGEQKMSRVRTRQHGTDEPLFYRPSRISDSRNGAKIWLPCVRVEKPDRTLAGVVIKKRSHGHADFCERATTLPSKKTGGSGSFAMVPEEGSQCPAVVMVMFDMIADLLRCFSILENTSSSDTP